MTVRKDGWTAIVLAGQRPGIDPLASAFGTEFKALVPIAGVPMLTRVCETLTACPGIARILVLGQQPEALRPAIPDPDIVVRASSAGISASISEAVAGPDAPWPVLVTTADHPLITCEMVEAVIAGSTNADVCVAMVERRTLQAAYPANKRTWRHFRGGAYSGANLFALTSARSGPALSLWAEAEGDRKKQLGLLLHFGPWLALRTFARTLTLDAALAAAGKRLGIRAKAVVLDQAEAAIDVDKPSDHALVQTILEAR